MLRRRLAGLTDAEYFWEPAEGCWNIRPAGTGPWPAAAGSGDWTTDHAFPEPAPPPVTTTVRRLGHLIAGVLGTRLASHSGGPETDYGSFAYAGTAEEALHQLDARYAEWVAGVRGLGLDGLEQPRGPSEGPLAEAPMAALVLHVTREVVHHGAEIGTLRDLWAHRPPAG
nr:DinB family protein [Streptomyces sp. SID8014]